MKEHDRKRLEREGWKRQTVTDEPRLTELVELYGSLGYEVLLIPFDPGDQPSECQVCLEDTARYKVIYTRKRQ